MAKKVVASTRIVHDGETIEPGQALDASKFTKDQLTRLYERGAVKIVDASEEVKEEPKLEDVTENTKTDDKDTAK